MRKGHVRTIIIVVIALVLFAILLATLPRPSQEAPRGIVGIPPEIPEVVPPPTVAPEAPPEEENITPEVEAPPRTDLAPEELSLAVGPIEAQGQLIKRKEDRIRQYTGHFGTYDADPREELDVQLCALPSDSEPFESCDIVETTFADNHVRFNAVYDVDEYIGGIARREFVIQFIVLDKQGNELARSKSALVEFVKD